MFYLTGRLIDVVLTNRDFKAYATVEAHEVKHEDFPDLTFGLHMGDEGYRLTEASTGARLGLEWGNDAKKALENMNSDLVFQEALRYHLKERISWCSRQIGPFNSDFSDL